jgi:hypothetical protein
MELADLFLLLLPKEGVRGDGWCLVTIMDQGKPPPPIHIYWTCTATVSILSRDGHPRIKSLDGFADVGKNEMGSRG